MRGSCEGCRTKRYENEAPGPTEPEPVPATESTPATERMPMLEPKQNPSQSLGQGDSAPGLSRIPSTLDLDLRPTHAKQLRLVHANKSPPSLILCAASSLRSISWGFRLRSTSASASVGDNGLQFIRSMATTVSLMSCAYRVACELACRQGATSAAHVQRPKHPLCPDTCAKLQQTYTQGRILASLDSWHCTAAMLLRRLQLGFWD